MTSSATYRIDTDNLTVIATDEKGESFDLNAGGEPCADMEDLRVFINDLYEQGAYGADERNALIREWCAA